MNNFSFWGSEKWKNSKIRSAKNIVRVSDDDRKKKVQSQIVIIVGEKGDVIIVISRIK